MTKIYKKLCPYCKKEITSLSERQFNYNYQTHLLTCKKNPEEFVPFEKIKVCKTIGEVKKLDKKVTNNEQK